MKNEKQINIRNKKAFFNFEILDKYEAGIVLYGTEIKSIKLGKANIVESFCQFKNNELYIINMRIDEYFFGTHYNHSTKRERKLLLHKRELEKLKRKVTQSSLTIVPLSLYINKKGLAKIQIALAQGKKTYDKRETLKNNENKRDLDRIKKNF